MVRQAGRISSKGEQEAGDQHTPVTGTDYARWVRDSRVRDLQMVCCLPSQMVVCPLTNNSNRLPRWSSDIEASLILLQRYPCEKFNDLTPRFRYGKCHARKNPTGMLLSEALEFARG